MPTSPSPPNDSIAELIAILGADDSRDLILTYMNEFDGLIRIMATGNREEQHRAAHSLKSSSHLLGLFSVSSHLKKLEARLAEPTCELTADDIAVVVSEYEGMIAPLRKFATGK